jgi:hypothetical protein
VRAAYSENLGALAIQQRTSRGALFMRKRTGTGGGERRQSQEAAAEADFHFEIVFVHEQQFSRETVGGRGCEGGEPVWARNTAVM